jgi:hypothetical protein
MAHGTSATTCDVRVRAMGVAHAPLHALTLVARSFGADTKLLQNFCRTYAEHPKLRSVGG